MTVLGDIHFLSCRLAACHQRTSRQAHIVHSSPAASRKILVPIAGIGRGIPPEGGRGLWEPFFVVTSQALRAVRFMQNAK